MVYSRNENLMWSGYWRDRCVTTFTAWFFSKACWRGYVNQQQGISTHPKRSVDPTKGVCQGWQLLSLLPPYCRVGTPHRHGWPLLWLHTTLPCIEGDGPHPNLHSTNPWLIFQGDEASHHHKYICSPVWRHVWYPECHGGILFSSICACIFIAKYTDMDLDTIHTPHPPWNMLIYTVYHLCSDI